jgi:photosystem II stability/assembly factor-like uncharacterized protein
MLSISPMRTATLALAATVAASGSVFASASGAATRSTSAAAKPPKTVTATLIAAPPGTLVPGSRVRPSAIFSQRVFTDGEHGFALGSIGGADYPLATANGGNTWKTDGPALHLHALQAPLAVEFIGAISRTTVYAWGGGQVIDATSDGGKHWYRALFPNGSPVAVAQDLNHHLLAFVASFTATATPRYVSANGGRTWQQ